MKAVLNFLFCLVLACSLTADSIDNDETTLPPAAQLSRTAAPVINIKGGFWEGRIIPVSISCPTEGAVIHYTTDGSEPSVESRVFKNFFFVKRPITVKAVAVHPEYGSSGVVESEPWITGKGVQEFYFENTNLTGRTYLKFAPKLEVDLGVRKPVKAIHKYKYAVAFAGEIIPPRTGEYELFFTFREGARIWFDGRFLRGVAWRDGKTDRCKKIKVHLVAGNAYPFKFIVGKSTWTCRARLEWRLPDGEREVIGMDYLRPEGRYVDELKRWSERRRVGGGKVYANRLEGGMTNPLSAEGAPEDVRFKLTLDNKHSQAFLNSFPEMFVAKPGSPLAVVMATIKAAAAETGTDAKSAESAAAATSTAAE